MKHYVFSVVLALCSFSLVADARRISRSIQIQSGACPLRFTGLIPNPEDCHSFYNCDGGIPGLIPCPANLCFNPTGPGTGACEHCNVVPGCENAATTRSPIPSEEPSTSTSGPTSSGEPGTSTAGPTSSGQPGTSTAGPTSSGQPGTSTAGPTSSGEPGTSTAGPTSSGAPGSSTAGPTSSAAPSSAQPPSEDLTCPSDPFIYMPYPGNCNRFYYCNDGINIGAWNCGQGLWFHFEQQACVYPWGSSCQ